MKFEIGLTQILAFWGTVISTIALIWNIVRGLQDRKKLKVEAYIGVMLPGDSSKKVFYVVMTNIGRRPVFVSGWGGLRKKEKGEKIRKVGIFAVARNLPKMLKEGEYNIEYIEDFSFFSHNIREVHAWDSTGKKWKINRKNLRRLLKAGREQLNSQARMAN